MDEFSPGEILENLERVLKLLVSEHRDAIPRHRSLQAAIEWSYRLLPPELQKLFVRLSVFRGGCNVEAVERVCCEIEARNALKHLVDYSLLKREPISNSRRFRMIEVYREFGDEKLSKESEAVRELELSIFLGHFWDIRGYWTEGRKRLRHALARQQAGASSLKARGLGWLGLLLYKQDKYKSARRSLSESIAMGREINDKETLAFSLYCFGLVARTQGDYPGAKSLFSESLELGEEVNSDWLIARALHGLGIAAEDDYRSVKEFCEKSLSRSEKIQDLRGMSISLNALGDIAREQGDFVEARRCYERSLVLRQGMGNKGGISYCYFKLGLVEEAIGVFHAALNYYQQSLDLHRKTGNRLGITRTLEGIGRMAEAMGSDEDAARIFGAANALRNSIAAPVSSIEEKSYGQVMSSVKEQFPLAWQEGSRWPLNEAITFASSFNAARAS